MQGSFASWAMYFVYGLGFVAGHYSFSALSFSPCAGVGFCRLDLGWLRLFGRTDALAAMIMRLVLLSCHGVCASVLMDMCFFSQGGT